MSVSDLLLLDTSAVLNIIRANDVAKRMDASLNLRSRPDKPLISVISIAESRAFARLRNWGDTQTARLEQQLRELVVVDINNASVLDRYAEIHVFCRSSGITIRDNDTWIAACASAAGAILVTNDTDFDRLHPKFVTRMYFPFKT